MRLLREMRRISDALERLVDGQERLVDGQERLVDGQERLVEGQEILRQGQELTRQSQEQIFREMVQFQREERLRANKVLEPLIASHNELVAESRAQRAALLVILDEIRGRGGPEQATA